MKNLLSSIEYGKLLEEKSTADFLYMVRRIEYDKILTSEPSIGMFIPATANGEIIFKPDPKDYENGENDEKYVDDSVQFYNAQRRVMFADFQVYVSGGLRKEDEEEVPLEQSIGIKGVLHIMWKKSGDSNFKLSHGIRTVEDLLKYNLEVSHIFQKTYYK